MELAQKFRIYPTKDQEDVSWILSEKCRLVYNFFLADRIKIHEETGVGLTYQMQQDYLPKLKSKYHEYEWVNSKVLQMTVHQLDDDYHSYFSKRKKGDKTARPPGYKGRDYFTTMIWNQSGFKVENGYIILNHYYNDYKDENGKKKIVKLKFKIPDDLIDNTEVCLQTIFDFGKIQQVVLYREEPHIKKDSIWSISVVYDSPTFSLKDNGLYQAIDLGIGKIVTAVNMDAKFFEIKNPRKDLYWNPIVDSIQKRRDHCKKEKIEQKVKVAEKDKHVNIIKDKHGKIIEKEKIVKVTKPSNRWISLNDNKKKCTKKARHQIKDDQHKWSDKMVKNTKSNTIIVGDLNIKDWSNQTLDDILQD